MRYDVKNLILFGGARLLADFAVYAKQSLPYELTVFSSKRHLDELIAGSKKTLRQILKKNKISFYDSVDINRDKNLKATVKPGTLGIAFGAAWVFEKKTVKLFQKKYLLDLMGIDLPRYRGGAHYTWMILHQNGQAAANLQVIEGGQDAFHRGSIIRSLRYELPAKLERPIDYFNFISAKELTFLKEFFQEIENKKNYKFTKLKEDESSYYPFLSTAEQGFINWQWSGEQIERFINAFDEPYAGASTYINNQIVNLKDSFLLPTQENYHPFTSGIIVRKDKTAAYAAVTDGILQIRKILDAKGKNIFRQVELGDRFHTPFSKLDSAMTFKAIYNSQGLRKP